MGTDSRAAPRLNLHECKIRASLLLKGLDSAELARATRAAERLGTLPAFSGLSPAQLIARKDSVRRKHALAVIAREQGYDSWVELKQALGEETSPRFDPESFFTSAVSSFLNHWFSSYPEALAALRKAGGFLFPFRQQFFVCEAGFLRALGVDPADPDWERMGRNWVEPLDMAAHARLEQKLIALGFTN
ncbi:hypothetical protein [Hyalangium versicolor]|uniref:hypothetical protein n=1 Tax=Hyalangium versicolor TaxID=2861190 RepID=UPI001CC91318|nr:hypothetical protein [Hyalangium versicolor]